MDAWPRPSDSEVAFFPASLRREIIHISTFSRYLKSYTCKYQKSNMNAVDRGPLKMCYTSPSASKSINSYNVSYLCISLLYTKKFPFSKHSFLITKYPLSSLCHQHYVPLVNCFLQIFWTSRTFHPQRLNKHDLRGRNCEV